MSEVSQRNQKVTNILAEIYEDALDENRKINENDYEAALDELFNTTAWGFREIILVVVVGMRISTNYRSSTGLYDCNPRSLFEGPIKNFLMEKSIPHRKSGPLNVAKATVGLDESWAAQRRPLAPAMRVVELVNMLEEEAEKETSFLDDFAVSLMRRFLKEVEAVEELRVTVDPTSDPNRLTTLACRLIKETPDGGNTPQKIAGLLLKWYHLGWETEVVVTGGDHRASVTSTTSHKPGDVNEERGSKLKVYEITVKPFGLPRIIDSYDAIKSYNVSKQAAIDEVIVICRQEDCPDEMISSGYSHYRGYLEYRDLTYYYWDIFEWVAFTLQHMTKDARYGFYQELNEYINHMNTAETVKALWKSLHTVSDDMGVEVSLC